jgi:L-asparaginase
MGSFVLDCIKNGARGVVIAGTGNGGLPNGSDQVSQALEMGLQIVVGTRSPYGASTPSREPTYAKSGYVHIIQARIMLQLALASRFNMKQDLFEGSLRKAIGQPFEY